MYTCSNCGDETQNAYAPMGVVNVWEGYGLDEPPDGDSPPQNMRIKPKLVYCFNCAKEAQGLPSYRRGL